MPDQILCQSSNRCLDISLSNWKLWPVLLDQWIYSLGTTNVCTFHGNKSNSCWYISVWIKVVDRLTHCAASMAKGKLTYLHSLASYCKKNTSFLRTSLYPTLNLGFLWPVNNACSGEQLRRGYFMLQPQQAALCRHCDCLQREHCTAKRHLSDTVAAVETPIDF